MPTEFTKGDLLATEGLGAYALGIHCGGTMESGIAVAFRKRWPAMFDAYRERCEARRCQLGDVLAWSDGEVTIYGLAVQSAEEKKPKLSALERSVRTMVELAAAANIERIGMARVAAGVDPRRVKRILTEVGGGTDVTLVVFEQFVRAPAKE